MSAALVQAFSLSVQDGVRPDLGYRMGVNMYVKAFREKITPRKTTIMINRNTFLICLLTTNKTHWSLEICYFISFL
jgi:hypothetical protein